MEDLSKIESKIQLKSSPQKMGILNCVNINVNVNKFGVIMIRTEGPSPENHPQHSWPGSRKWRNEVLLHLKLQHGEVSRTGATPTLPSNAINAIKGHKAYEEQRTKILKDNCIKIKSKITHIHKYKQI